MGKKILLADDSITIQKVIELTFLHEDFDVETVGNGRLALERLADVQPDIVLCDIIMPEKDGYEVCEYVKTSSAFSHVPVLLLTGAFEPFDQERAERVGSDGFLAKPFEPETLIAKVKDLLSRAPAPQSVEAPLGGAESGATAPQPVARLDAHDQVAASQDHPSPRLEEVPPAVPQSGTETAPPLGASLIPEEPFEAFDVDAGEVPATRPTEPVEPLATVSEDELATLSGSVRVTKREPDASESADSASTVMFTRGQEPWMGEAASPAQAPPGAEPPEPVEEVQPEPVLTPEPPTPDLADQAGAAFEEVLEEDLEFGTPGFGTAAIAGDTQVPMPSAALPEESLGSSTFEHPESTPAFATVVPPAPTGLGPERAPDFEPASIPHRSEAPSVYETVPRPEPEIPPVYEVAPPREPEAPAVYEVAPPREPEIPPVYEVAPPREPEAPPVYEVAPPREPEAPPVYEVASPREPEIPPVYEAVPPREPEAPPVYEAVPPREPEAPPVYEAVPPRELEAPPVFERPEPPYPETTLPPLGHGPAFESAVPPEPIPERDPGPPARAEFEPAPEERTAPTPILRPEFEPPPAPYPAGLGRAPEPEPEFEFEAELAPEPVAEAPVTPAEPVISETLPAGREQVVESFADVETGGETEELPPSRSEAALVPVPVDDVEKIAQRVVAQVSEKVVREIAWEVIPDLAEALIKQEIERLRAELRDL